MHTTKMNRLLCAATLLLCGGAMSARANAGLCSPTGQTIARTMNNPDDPNRRGFPGIGDNVFVEIPKTILPAEKFVVIVTDAWVPAQLLQLSVELCPNPFRSVRAVFGDVGQNFTKVALGIGGDYE